MTDKPDFGLRQYLDSKFESITKDIKSLSDGFHQMELVMQELRIRMESELGEVKKDLDHAFSMIRDLKTQQESEEANRVQGDISLGKLRAEFEKDQDSKWDELKQDTIPALDKRLDRIENRISAVLWITGVAGAVFIGFIVTRLLGVVFPSP